MGREVKRVPENFDWFERHAVKTERGSYDCKNWWGYVLHNIPCEACNMTGINLKGDDCELCYGDKTVTPTIEVPTGDYYQMWQNTSEGSPISPAFKTPEELARWLVDNKASTFGYQTTTYDNWLAMIKSGSAPSMVISNGVLMSGVDFVNS